VRSARSLVLALGELALLAVGEAAAVPRTGEVPLLAAGDAFREFPRDAVGDGDRLVDAAFWQSRLAASVFARSSTFARSRVSI